MRKEMVIRVQTNASEKGKAIKVAAGVKGVESVTLAGEDKNLLLVIGVGVDPNRITKKLRRKVGHAEVVELRTVDGADELAGGGGRLVVPGPAEHAYRYHPMSPSPYYAGGGGYPARGHYPLGPSPFKHHQQHAAGRDYYYGGVGDGGYYPATQYQQQQQQHLYQPPPGTNTHTVVHHEYANDPNSCAIM